MRTALEVHQRFFDTTLAARHFLEGTVSIGSRVGWRWSFLGVDMGAIPDLMRHVLPYTPPMWSTVAAEPLTSFQDQGHDAHDLFVHEDGAWICQVPAGWNAVVDGEAVDGDVPVTGSIELSRGDVHYRAALVPAPAAPTRTASEPDAPLLGTLGFLGATAALFAMAVAFTPSRPEVGVLELDERAVTMAVQLPEAPKAPPEKPKPVQVAGGGSGGPASPDVPSTATGPATDAEIAQSAGLFASDLLDSFGGDLGGDLMAAAGQLRGSSSGLGPAIGSLAGRGTSLSGGGSVGGIGGLSGPGRNGDPGRLAYGGGPQKGQGVIASVSGGTTTLVGSLKKSEIEAVIHRSLTSIRYCYQRELQRTPGLGGKVVVRFVVAGDGSVSSSGVKQSSMGSEPVESCILDRFQRMTFPAPRGGGMAIVSYPFLFSPG